MKCTIDCPDRGKCYLENQCQCCAVFRANSPKGEARFKKLCEDRIYRARHKDKRDPIPGAKQIMSVYDDELLPKFMQDAKAKRLREVYS